MSDRQASCAARCYCSPDSGIPVDTPRLADWPARGRSHGFQLSGIGLRIPRSTPVGRNSDPARSTSPPHEGGSESSPCTGITQPHHGGHGPARTGGPTGNATLWSEVFPNSPG